MLLLCSSACNYFNLVNFINALVKRGPSFLSVATASPTFPFTKESINFVRFCRLLIDVGSNVLRETFDKNRPPGELETVFGSPSVLAALQLLRKKGILDFSSWKKLYPANKSSVSTKNFDSTLLIVLLRNICGLNPPATGWDALPSPKDLSPEADIARIKFYRNTVYAHATHASIDDAEFDDYWTNLRDAIVRLGGDDYAKFIDDQRWDFLDRQHREHYKDVIKEWKDGIMNKLGKLETFFNKTTFLFWCHAL